MSELPVLRDALNFWPVHVSIRSVGGLFLLSLVVSARADISAGSPGLLPPQVEPVASRVLRGGQVTITLRGHYGGTSPLRFAIVRPPAHGNLSGFRELGDNRASVSYTPDGTGKKEVDGFSYLAQAGSRASAPAEVSIAIEEPPARLDIPAQLDFGEVATGKSSSRQLTIRNAGGGILSGRLTISSPWKIAATDYQVAAGATQNVTVVFQPNESRDFVGQITLTGDAGETATVSLGGTVFGAVRLSDSPEASATATPIDSPRLAATAKETSEISASRPSPPVAASLHVETPAASQPAVVTPEIPVAPALLSAPAPSPEGTPQIALNTAVKITAHRLSPSSWEVRWPADKKPGTMYRLEERMLSLDHRGELKVAWRELAGPKLNLATNPIVAPVRQLTARHAHFLRLTALNREGALLWESPLFALEAAPASSRRQLWLIGLAVALVALLFLRWKERLPA